MEIREAAREATQAMLDKYECGIRITDLQLQRVTPPGKVAPSFSAIQEAVQTKTKLENEANKEKNTLLPKARAERDKLIREAEGYAARRRSEVKGEIDALMVQYEQFAKAPEETRQRLYLESMQKVLSNVENKTIIDSDLQQLLPLLNLSEGSK
jgi:membrane protease subunit HflK